VKITLLGTGTSQGIPIIGCECETCLSQNSKDKRLRTACLVEINDKRIVIDIGPDFRQQMLAVGGKEVHAILISHEHNDHVAGLDDVRPFNFKYMKDMPVYALDRVAKHIKNRFDYIFKVKPYSSAPRVKLITIDGNTPIEIEGIPIVPIHILHGELPILGYRIGNFAYLTDVKSIPEEEFKKLKNLDILILSALRKEVHLTHLTLDEAIALSKKIAAKQTYFTHLSHLMGPHEEIEQLLPQGISAGYDGLSKNIEM
jgi:phosphoribosyl 1,2-cyclic phosphate phosphodiesterase